MLNEALACRENRGQELLGRRRRPALVEQPADRFVEIRGRPSRKIPEAVHAAALVLRAIVARTCSATSSPFR
jgi:hypothetical protein